LICQNWGEEKEREKGGSGGEWWRRGYAEGENDTVESSKTIILTV